MKKKKKHKIYGFKVKVNLPNGLWLNVPYSFRGPEGLTWKQQKDFVKANF